MHYSVGAVIKNELGAYLLIDRLKVPLGYAGIAGHVDEGELPETALEREVREESGLVVVRSRLLFEEERPGNVCSRGINTHHWRLYACEVSGEIRWNQEETKSIDWYSKKQVRSMRNELESIWQYWFTKLGVF